MSPKTETRYKILSGFCSPVVAGVLILHVSGCTGCTLTERRDVLNVARTAVAAARDLPPDAVLLPTSKWEVYVAKNAAQVYIPYSYTDSAGRQRGGTYMVRAKRVKLTWVLDHCRSLPDYGQNAGPQHGDTTTQGSVTL